MNAQGAAGIVAGVVICFGLVIVVALVIQILFLLSLMRTMKRVGERNREMAPGMVFLTLIPLFGMIWAIIMVQKIATSLENEFKDRGWRAGKENFGRTVGMIWAWGAIANIVLSVIRVAAQLNDMGPIAMVLGLLSLPVGLAILVCFIMYWVQIHQYGTRLGDRGYKSGSMEEDFDDLPRDRRRDDDEDYDDRRRRQDD